MLLSVPHHGLVGGDMDVVQAWVPAKYILLCLSFGRRKDGYVQAGHDE